MKYRYTLGVLFVAATLCAMPSFAGAQNCSAYPGFVWSQVSRACVQEICPVDAIGRDVREGCLCPENTRPIVERALLTACTPLPKEKKEVADVTTTTTKSIPLPLVATSSESTAAQTAPSTKNNGATSTPQVRRGLVWPVATPTTVTLIFVVALAIAYYLWKNKK